MKRFYVHVFRTITDDTFVEVEAPNSEMAETLAIEKVEENSSQFSWSSYDGDLEATEVEEIAPTAA